MDTSPAGAPLFWALLLQWKQLASGNAAETLAGGQLGCPAHCQCDQNGMMLLLRVDCSNLGLTGIPANLSVFTSYLKQGSARITNDRSPRRYMLNNEISGSKDEKIEKRL